MSNYKFSDHQKVLSDIDRLPPSSHFTFGPVRKKNKINLFKFSIKDGYMTMIAELYPKVMCPCMSSNTGIKYKYCKHILKIFMEYFGFSSHIVTYFHLPEINIKFHDLVMLSEDPFTINSELLEVLNKSFSGECGVCSEDLNHKKFDMNLYQCQRCTKYVHSNCMQNWNTKRLDQKGNGPKKPPPENGCIYCREKMT